MGSGGSVFDMQGWSAVKFKFGVKVGGGEGTRLPVVWTSVIV